VVQSIDIGGGRTVRIGQQLITKDGVAQLAVQLNGKGLPSPTTIAQAATAVSLTGEQNIQNIISSLRLVNGG